MQIDLQEHLVPYNRRPIPLPNDFFRRIIDINPPETIPLNELIQLDKSRIYESEISQITEEIVESNESRINAASRRLARSSTAAPTGTMFNDLVSVSFDEQKFIENAENRLEKQRQSAVRSFRRPSY